MTFTITAPGIYADVPTADYFADPVVAAPSLTQSIAKVLIERSPAHAWIEHPRLNPNWQPDDPTKYDIGNIAHALLLGRGKVLQVIEADDWRTKDAKAQRDICQAEGKLGVLAKHYEIGREMAAAAGRQLAQRGYEWDWADGAAEVVIAAQQGDLWLRAMIDWLANDRRRVWDLKTTAASASPYALDWRMVDQGWDVQAAMHEKLLDIVDPDNAGRREHLFVVQENFEPFALSVVRLPESVLTMGRKRLDYAIKVWAGCLARNEWPAYPLETVTVSYPGAAETRWLDREIVESERDPKKLYSLMGG